MLHGRLAGYFFAGLPFRACGAGSTKNWFADKVGLGVLGGRICLKINNLKKQGFGATDGCLFEEQTRDFVSPLGVVRSRCSGDSFACRDNTKVTQELLDTPKTFA